MFDLIGRQGPLLDGDIRKFDSTLIEVVSGSSFLVVGGAGSIGQAVVKQIFSRNPKKLLVIDISENNLVELVRDIRSSLGYVSGDFRTFVVDVGSGDFEHFLKKEGPFDFILNLSALKHVRSEKDEFSLMRLIETNIFNAVRCLTLPAASGSKKYFAVSSDKATNPVNMMGASKRIMEKFIFRHSDLLTVSTARFANVAFSDGSLLHGFNLRIQKRQPFAAPNDVKRYFITQEESGQICLLTAILGDNLDTFFPKLSNQLNLITFSEIATRFLNRLGFEAFECENENEARLSLDSLVAQGKWPCYFFKSDTTGEKDFEEFYSNNQTIDWEKFENLAVIKNIAGTDFKLLDDFYSNVTKLRRRGGWTKENLLEEFFQLLPEFKHEELGKNLDQKM
ncbi:MAG: UDP-N-acetylglucosamine 4,6-dehydratase [Bacteroidetes bacterium]|nr:UDP-N-acetylglucosamine 4,6-dehydratase [Bacteroidota bacterium]